MLEPGAWTHAFDTLDARRGRRKTSWSRERGLEVGSWSLATNRFNRLDARRGRRGMLRGDIGSWCWKLASGKGVGVWKLEFGLALSTRSTLGEVGGLL